MGQQPRRNSGRAQRRSARRTVLVQCAEKKIQRNQHEECGWKLCPCERRVLDKQRVQHEQESDELEVAQASAETNRAESGRKKSKATKKRRDNLVVPEPAGAQLEEGCSHDVRQGRPRG